MRRGRLYSQSKTHEVRANGGLVVVWYADIVWLLEETKNQTITMSTRAIVTKLLKGPRPFTRVRVSRAGHPQRFS
jgi:hypothetical protein